MEFLLINHPLDCPICDKGGECPLQNQAMSHGQAETRFPDVKRTYPKPINISANVLLDRERCVLCARCTRFSEQVAGDPFIALIERGALQQVGIYEKEPLHSYFSGNTIQICPVGALTSSSAYRFRSRPFDLVSVPSIAEHDACGSAIRVDYRRGQVMRRLAGDDPEVNEEWITDKDRFAFSYGRGADRLTRPLVRDLDDDGTSVLRPASWPEAIDVAVRGLQAALNPLDRSATAPDAPSMTAEPGQPGGCAHRRSADPGGRVRVREVRPRRARHQQHRLPVPAAQPGGGRVPGPRRGGHRARRHLRRPASRPTGCCWSAFEPEEEAGAIFLRLRKAVRKQGLPGRDRRART